MLAVIPPSAVVEPIATSLGSIIQELELRDFLLRGRGCTIANHFKDSSTDLTASLKNLLTRPFLRAGEVPNVLAILNNPKFLEHLPAIAQLLATCESTAVLNVTAAFVRSNAESAWVIKGQACDLKDLKQHACALCAAPKSLAFMDSVDPRDYLQLALAAVDQDPFMRTLQTVFGSEKKRVKVGGFFRAKLTADETFIKLEEVQAAKAKTDSPVEKKPPPTRPEDTKSLADVVKDFRIFNQTQKNPLPHGKITDAATDLRMVLDRAEKLKGVPLVELKALIDQEKRNYQGDLTPDQRLTYFALAREVMLESTGLYPNLTQMFSLMILSDPNIDATKRGRCMEIPTGEGKSLIEAIQAGFFACCGHKTAVLPDNLYLAERDKARFEKFFSSFGFSSDHLDSEKDLATKFMKPPHVVYSTMRDLAFARLISGRQGLKPYIPDRAVIDEADKVLCDAALDLFRLSTRGPEIILADNLKSVFLSVKETVERDKEIDCQALAEKLVRQAELKHLGLPIIRLLTTNAAEALEMENDVQYVVTGETVVLVDVQKSDRILPSSFLTGGKHEFLCLKHDLPLPDPMLTEAHMSVAHFVKLIPNIVCLSGTIGNVATRFDLEEIRIPHHTQPQSFEVSPRVFKTNKARLNAFFGEYETSQKLPYLVIPGSIKQSNLLATALQANGFQVQVLNDFQNLNIHGQPATEQSIVEDAGKFEIITVATGVAGRGTDIPLAPGVQDKGGLKVVQFGLASKRETVQRGGRKGRQGQKGEFDQMISLEEDTLLKTLPQEVTTCLGDLVDAFGESGAHITWAIDIIHAAYADHQEYHQFFLDEEREELLEIQDDYFDALITARAAFLEISGNKRSEVNEHLDHLIRKKWTDLFNEVDLQLAAYSLTLELYQPGDLVVAKEVSKLLTKLPPPSPHPSYGGRTISDIFSPALKALGLYVINAWPMHSDDTTFEQSYDDLRELVESVKAHLEPVVVHN